MLLRNVATLSRPPNNERTEGRTLSPAQARHFLETLHGRRAEALHALMLSTGLRRGEALGLMWKDLDREGGVFRVARQLKRATNRRGLVATDTKTLRSRRAVNLPDRILTILDAHEQQQAAHRQRADARWTQCPGTIR